MAYLGQAAYRLDASQEEALTRSFAPSLEVIEGAGLDAQARRGVSPEFLARVRAAGIVIAVSLVLGLARVGLYAGAAAVLADNTTLRSEIKEAGALADELAVQRSVLSNRTRIARIATQSYGMVAAGEAEQMVAGTLYTVDETQDASASDSAADASGLEASEDATAEDAAAKAIAVEDTASAEEAAAADAASTEDAAAEASDEGFGSQALENVTLTEGDGSTAGANSVSLDELL